MNINAWIVLGGVSLLLWLVRLSLVDHLFQLVLGHVLSKFIGDALQVFKCDVVLVL